jgi:hypothetical protein
VSEQGDDRVDATSAEGVVGEVELVEGGVRFEGVAESSESEGDFGDESVGEDVGKVGNLCWWGCISGVVACYD